jgi:arylsulfatase A-like enzyme
VPFIVRFPDAWQDESPQAVGTRSSTLLSLADLLPTICDVTGAPVPDDVDGSSILPLMHGDTTRLHDCIHGQIGSCHMLADDSFKYLYFTDDGCELLFSAHDRHDAVAVASRIHVRQAGDSTEGVVQESGDLETLRRYREAFAAHLREERHPDYDTESGDVLNRRLPRPSLREALAADQSGLGALGWAELPLGDIQSLH